MSKNKYSGIIRQFLKFSQKESLDDLVNLSSNVIQELIISYRDTMILFQTNSTVEYKVNALWYFYDVNGIEIDYEPLFDGLEYTL